MIPNRSPWIAQLKRTRPAVPLQTDLKTDVLIVGGGIAGATTAYFALKNTDKNVVLVEADMIAHGATGHNAGQITSYFERPLSEIIEEFGFEKAIAGQRDVESAWRLIDEIYADAKLTTPLYKFTGYAGCTTKEQFLSHLHNNTARVKGGLPTEMLMVSEESGLVKELPRQYRSLYEVITQKELLSLLETQNTDYVALLAYQKGCMNSALFTEELIGYMSSHYKGRFSFFEESPVTEVITGKNSARVRIGKYTVSTQRVVLCTNGFSNFTIHNENGPEINTAFHHLVNGRIGYMTGYLDSIGKPPTAISYFPDPEKINTKGDPTGETYYYMTRRPHEHEDGKAHNLICMGGPEKVLPSQALYSRQAECSESVQATIAEFLENNYKDFPRDGATYHFCWHGLMGYTPNGIRRVGAEPCNSALLYNLGCNGVGILPSIFGGYRISRILKGEKLESSIFDPYDNRCVV